VGQFRITPVVPRIELEVLLAKPLEPYSVTQAKTTTEKQAWTGHRHVACKFVAGFIKLQKHSPARSLGLRSKKAGVAAVHREF
jgi:hypothetical protein